NHRFSRCTQIAIDIQRMTHIDIFSNPNMLYPPPHRPSDDRSRKEVRPERGELGGAMAKKNAGDISGEPNRNYPSYGAEVSRSVQRSEALLWPRLFGKRLL
ncbi:MAG TPA: hypothetical protein VJU02_07880, partial [Nitrospiraceae bacterium]|nr:hypothetical protein [Nitrospiraceae bacterium]